MLCKTYIIFLPSSNKSFLKSLQDTKNWRGEIHDRSGPLSEKTRWLIKIAFSAAGKHERALETHLMKAKEAGVTNDEIAHALLLMIPTSGFPAFMEAYSVFKGIK